VSAVNEDQDDWGIQHMTVQVFKVSLDP